LKNKKVQFYFLKIENKKIKRDKKMALPSFKIERNINELNSIPLPLILYYGRQLINDFNTIENNLVQYIEVYQISNNQITNRICMYSNYWIYINFQNIANETWYYHIRFNAPRDNNTYYLFNSYVNNTAGIFEEMNLIERDGVRIQY
tara:strand:+ start:460 stop:900 length:441 start_codon:yes stop_codon:yes gene_type:complete